MSSTDRTEQLRLGFLTALETPDRAFVGGLLITDRFGRPLEFQCTTPVKPNRTQELLYGPTLVPFILGELLGRTLCERVSIKPQIVFVDREEMLPLRTCVSVPVLCIRDQSPASPDERPTVSLGKHQCRLHDDFPDDEVLIKKYGTLLTPQADMKEPLIRVLEALKETIGTAVPQARSA